MLIHRPDCDVAVGMLCLELLHLLLLIFLPLCLELRLAQSMLWT